MKRNENSKCANCPYYIEIDVDFGSCQYLRTQYDSVNETNVYKDFTSECDICSHHPDFYGFTTAQCGQCAWAGRHIEIKTCEDEYKKAAFCRRVAWAGHVVNVQSNLLEADMNAMLKVSLDTGLVMLNSRACPAFMPRCDEPEAAPCELK